MKQVASGGVREVTAVLLAVLTAACVLQPAGDGPPIAAPGPPASEGATTPAATAEGALSFERSDAAQEGPPIAPADTRGASAALARDPLAASIPDGDRPLVGIRRLDAIAEQTMFIPLPIAEHPDAILGLPAPGDERRPVVVAIHGLGGRPGPICRAWRTITQARAFVLCLRGDYDPSKSSAGDPRYTHPGGAALEGHVEAGLDALRRSDARADVDRPLLVGFSLGASEVAMLAQAHPRRYPRIAILEGGVDAWVDATIQPFAAGGGLRVLFGCGSDWCVPSARGASARIVGAGIASRLVVRAVGHTHAPALLAAVTDELPWLTDGDVRWSASRAPQTAAAETMACE